MVRKQTVLSLLAGFVLATTLTSAQGQTRKGYSGGRKSSAPSRNTPYTGGYGYYSYPVFPGGYGFPGVPTGYFGYTGNYFLGNTGYTNYFGGGYALPSPPALGGYGGAFPGLPDYLNPYGNAPQGPQVITVGWWWPPIVVQNGGARPLVDSTPGSDYRVEETAPAKKRAKTGEEASPSSETEKNASTQEERQADATTEPAVPETSETIAVRREAGYRLWMGWQGDPSWVQRITFALLDANRQPLRRQVVTRLPAEARFFRSSRAAYTQVVIEYVDGTKRTVVSAL